ncbi:hypothetical protein C6Y14_17980 [Streptomyces dioscori]|uniref:Pectinesterase n=1 Tax=Streptomyces dioscori TaxID=2109333 RepID=A0A2P8Q7U0_9ACTN|nr:pectinesterase family protein [Streptomyces dioscori]PSM42282.1 hypothetical protein C6Y14_17980 [Streptomyces dioscori]
MRRRTLITGAVGAVGALAAAGASPVAAASSSSDPRRRVLHVRPGDSVQAAVDVLADTAGVTGDRSRFERVRFLAHQDTLFADTTALGSFDRQYYRGCHIEGDVDFVFGRGRAVFDGCRLHTLDRDVSFRPEGMVFAPATARANPYGFLAVRCRVTSGAEDGAYKVARPWVPSYETTAWPSLVVRDTWLGPGIDAAAPYIDMREAYPWQTMRFREHANSGPGAVVPAPENRPQLTAAEAASHTRRTYLGDWRPYEQR